LRFNLNIASAIDLPGKREPVPTETLLPLEYLGTGEWAEVEHVLGEPSWIGRMAELGVRVGSRLRILQPGSPCLLDLGSSRLCLRGEALMQVLVRPVSMAG
jgi:Fe2+ transport system protein FeoA